MLTVHYFLKRLGSGKFLYTLQGCIYMIKNSKKRNIVK